MKKLVLFAFCILTFVLAALDYADAQNWVVCDQGEPSSTCEFDVFYVYPTLVADRDKPLMDCNLPEVRRKTENFVRAQTNLWGDRARVFAPYIRQLEFFRAIRTLNDPWEKTEMKTGIDETREAFQYYLAHYNHGRPFILLGHSQGSVDLYCLLKNEKSLSVETGLVAAYLIGLPQMTGKKFAADFAGRSIAPATDAATPGVVVIWNTQSPLAKDSVFSVPGGLCINPLNWRTDETAALPAENVGAFLYDYRDNSSRYIPHFCGAVIDREKGALIVDLPEASSYDFNGAMGVGVFHGNDIWFFAGNLRDNAWLRLQRWRDLKK